MKRLKGPDLKMSELKVPPFLADIYWDLRERHLLPLLALVVVAIAAVPFLLGEDAEETMPAPAETAAVAAESEAAQTSSLTVVQAKPGLRDYHERLHRLKRKNPFRQKFTGPMLKGAKLNAQTEPSSGSNPGSTTTIPTSGSGETGPSSPGGAPSGGGHVRHEITFFAVAINVKITKQGEEPIVKKRVLPQTPLPGEKTPVVTYMGPGTKDKKATGRALLLVSNEVQSIFGEAKCVEGDEVCQLLEVEPGFPVTFLYGENEVRYTIDVTKIGLVVTGHKRFTEARMKAQNFTK